MTIQRATKYHRRRIETNLAKLGVVPFEGTTVHAYINHGRLVADCPCNGAELVSPGLPMLCGSCGAEHKVEFPKALSKIEAALQPRPVTNQNYTVGQSVDELVAENIDHGIGVF